MTRSALLVLGAWTASLVTAATASGQDDLGAVLAERQKAVPKGRHAFQETWLLPVQDGAGGPNQFAGRVNVYQDGPRERIEVRANTDSPVLGREAYDGSRAAHRVEDGSARLCQKVDLVERDLGCHPSRERVHMLPISVHRHRSVFAGIGRSTSIERPS